ncbi:MAG: HpcH/HpaI aldolase family protein [Gemmatimonadaceae bacterium]
MTTTGQPTDDGAAAAPSLHARLHGGDTLIGTLLSFPSADVAELLAGIGFDWLFVDGEHGPFDTRALLDVVRASGATPCLVRTPVGDDAAIARALDIGAAGVIVPQVHGAAQAEHVASVAHYPPAGRRGVGITRAGGYGRQLRAPLGVGDGAVTVVVQAESAAAVADIAAIARVPGIDAVLVGPNDLAASLGYPGQPTHPVVQRAIGQVVDGCRAAGRAVGIFGATAAAVRPWMERGVTLIVAGADALLLGQAARALHDALAAAAPARAAAVTAPPATSTTGNGT